METKNIFPMLKVSGVMNLSISLTLMFPVRIRVGLTRYSTADLVS